MVHARDKGAVEVTDLGVDQTERGHGIGRMLVASAAKTGLQFGRSKVTLAAQDRSSGHLTQWYKGMGFTQIGVNQRGYPQLEAPIGRILAGTVQRAREKIEQGMDYVVLENPYKEHVKLRIRIFSCIIMEIWNYRDWCKVKVVKPTLHRMQSIMAPTAKNQVGEGIYSNYTGNKYDAAHFVNTTVSSAKLTDMNPGLTHKQIAALQELQESSGATRMQLKADNVGPDKVIDGCFTNLRVSLENMAMSCPHAKTIVQQVCSDCKAALQASTKTGNPNYQAAITGIQEIEADIDGFASAVDGDKNVWLMTNDFVIDCGNCQTANLPGATYCSRCAQKL